MKPERYADSIGEKYERDGGQTLIMPEIITLLDGYPRVWLPFQRGQWLDFTLRDEGHETSSDIKTDIDAMYFGTPTIVDNKPLFTNGLTNPAVWTKRYERMCVRSLVRQAFRAGARIVVSGLGSGDITVQERMFDMGPGTRIEAYKHFGTFDDWVLSRRRIT